MKKELSGLVALLGLASAVPAMAQDLPPNTVLITDAKGNLIRAIPLNGEVSELALQQTKTITVNVSNAVADGCSDNIEIIKEK